MSTHDESAGREADELRRATTYEQAEALYPSTTAAQERFGELTDRDILARAIAILQDRGTYDWHLHPDRGSCPPLSVGEHLEVLAAGEVLARHYRHPALLHKAVQAGATWRQIAAATGTSEAIARQNYREWADDQHRLHTDLGAEFGLDDAEHAAAIARAAESPAAPEPEAGA